MMIRLLVLDVDGVLTDGEAQALDLGLLEELRNINRAARDDASRPAVTLCTGRPAPYVELMLQAIDGHLPAVFENGTGLYIPKEYRFMPHPDLDDLKLMELVRLRLEETLVHSEIAYFQPGKSYTLTLFATNSNDTLKLSKLTAVALGSLVDSVELVYSTTCLNILPRGFHKGRGITLLAKQTEYQPEEMLGIGDSDVDLPFLAAVGYHAAPANANEMVKQLVQYVSPQPTSAGVWDILRHFGLTN